MAERVYTFTLTNTGQKPRTVLFYTVSGTDAQRLPAEITLLPGEQKSATFTVDDTTGEAIHAVERDGNTDVQIERTRVR
jgi:hypothetical protein